MSIKHAHATVAAGVICCALAACGSAAGPATTSAAATTTDPTASSDPVAALLPRPGEFPGFTATAAIRTAHTIAQSIADETTGQATDASNLKADGFRENLSQPLSGANGQENGIASVSAFSSAAGATRYKTYLYGTVSKPGPETGSASQANFTHFSVPHVPGALGSGLVSERTDAVTANVQWTEGDCTIELGDETATASQPLSSPLIAAAQAIYSRTKGMCGG